MKQARKMKIQKNYFLLIGILILFVLGVYSSYALFTVKKETKDVLQIVSGNLYAKLTNENGAATIAYKSISSQTKFTILPHEEKTIVLKVENVNQREAKFNLYYQVSRKENFKIGYLENNPVLPTEEGFLLEKNGSQEFMIRMYNQGTDSVTVTFHSQVGLANKPLSLPQNAQKLEVYSQENGPAVTALLSKANQGQDTASLNQELYPFSMTSIKQSTWKEEEKQDYRYVGENPNNYALIQNERYRIIGVFGTKDAYGVIEKRIKVVKEEPIQTERFQTEANNEYGASLIKKTLDDYYYSLEDDTKKMIANVEWYLGDFKNLEFQNLYQQERNRSQDSIDLLTMIAPLYASDYLYSYALGFNSTCFQSNQNCQGSYLGNLLAGKSSWLLSYNSLDEERNHVASIHTDGTIQFSSDVQEEKAVYPSFYLQTNVEMTGQGTIEEPYQFHLSL